MNKPAIEKYTNEELLKGRTKQEIFNEIVTRSDYNIHDLASLIRKVPTPEKRKKYRSLNMILIGITGLTAVSRFLAMTGVIEGFSNKSSISGVLSVIVPVLIIYSIVNYKRNAHLIAGILTLVNVFVSLARLLAGTEAASMHLANVIVYAIAATLAFYLNSKLTGDYILNTALQKENPGQREDIVTFSD